MKRYTFLVALMLFVITSCGYNKLVEFDERADKHWYQIEDAYNRQNDLVPLLLKQYPQANRNDIAAIEKARKYNVDISIPKDEIEMSKIKKYVSRQLNFTQPLDNILISIYNDVKKLPNGNTQREELKTLASQIVGSHNRIAIACEKYNDVVDDYNEYQGGLTQKATAGSMGFHHKEKLNVSMFDRTFPNFEKLDSPKEFQ